MGLGAGKYQPTPKRVVGIKRAVRVAAGADHTIVLVTASLPPLPYMDTSFSTVNSQLCVGPIAALRTPSDSSVEVPVNDEEVNEDSVGGGQLITHEDDTSSIQAMSVTPLSLKQICEQQVADCVHLRNVLTTLSFAEFYDCQGLSLYCVDFILRYTFMLICCKILSLIE